MRLYLLEMERKHHPWSLNMDAKNTKDHPNLGEGISLGTSISTFKNNHTIKFAFNSIQ